MRGYETRTRPIYKKRSKPRNSRTVPENSCALSFSASFMELMSFSGCVSPNENGNRNRMRWCCAPNNLEKPQRVGVMDK